MYRLPDDIRPTFPLKLYGILFIVVAWDAELVLELLCIVSGGVPTDSLDHCVLGWMSDPCIQLGRTCGRWKLTFRTRTMWEIIPFINYEVGVWRQNKRDDLTLVACACRYTRKHSHIHTHTPHKHSYNTCTSAHMHAHAHALLRTHTHAQHSHTHACTHAHTHARKRTHARTYTNTHTHARTHARTHTHTHTHFKIGF